MKILEEVFVFQNAFLDFIIEQANLNSLENLNHL